MDKNAAKAKSRKRILAVGFDSNEVERLSRVCTDAEFLQAATVTQVNDLVHRSSHGDIDLLLVSTTDQDERTALMDCVQLRDQNALGDVPLLAAISRYQIGTGREIGRLKQTDFIIQPIEARELGKKLQTFGLRPPDD